ncbi:dormancy-associated protein homolog 3-like isoform X2 [Ananas comosus]|uniref:Auxin-repressed 12.5 kDa protein n=1 Tax=Ananas comosus TaxID=4615 RepID=A0A199W353_ANACO|nr:dormancy-associated protein homolog 3-like isoform X2 [Ananas comosus]OAY83330.1 Auxin-repressed 12.5 kDa protein [Ananas comosus]
MSLLDQLWDDTVAGPRPESGLGKLRKYASFSPSSSSPSSSVVVTSANAAVFAPNITRSITVIRTPPSSAASSPRGASVPSSPAAAPESPFASPTPRGSWKSLRRKPTTPTTAAEGAEKVGPRSPNVYDWMVISSLDR